MIIWITLDDSEEQTYLASHPAGYANGYLLPSPKPHPAGHANRWWYIGLYALQPRLGTPKLLRVLHPAGCPPSGVCAANLGLHPAG